MARLKKHIRANRENIKRTKHPGRSVLIADNSKPIEIDTIDADLITDEAFIMKWKEEAGSKLRAPITGGSRATLFRKQVEERKSAQIMRGSKNICGEKVESQHCA